MKHTIQNKDEDIEEALLDFLPELKKINIEKISSESIFIGAAGFEDRCFTFLDTLIGSNKKINNVIGVEYLPFNPKNRKDEYEKKGSTVSHTNTVTWRTYNRYSPNQFYSDFKEISSQIEDSSEVIVDISGMSKFLIVVLLDILKKYEINLLIIYSEAEIYHPTQEEYEIVKTRSKESAPTFLTKDIYNIVTTPSLSSISMANSPLLVISFPNFNNRELMALLSEITPQYLIKIEGVPHKKKDHWRLQAVHELNQNIDNTFLYDIDEIIHEKLTTFNYEKTVTTLEKICTNKRFRYTHKCIIAPTGSKLQTLGVFLFKQVYPETQLVYPVTTGFAEEYTEGYAETYTLYFTKFSRYVKKLQELRKSKLLNLKRIIDNRTSENSK